jgi:hypothetical protein
LQHGRLEARETGGEKMFERAPARFERGRMGPQRFGRRGWRGRVHDIFLDFEASFNKPARRAQPFSPPKVNAACERTLRSPRFRRCGHGAAMVGCEGSLFAAESSPEEPFARPRRHSTAVPGVVDRVGGAGRIVVQVNVAYESDPEVVRELLIAAAKAQESALSIPASLALFHDFGDWALKFELICFVDDIVTADRVRSDMNFDIFRRLREAGLRAPYPK